LSHFIQKSKIMQSTEDLSAKIHRRIQSIEKLLKAAEIVNEGWTPDWNNEFQYKYFITIVRSMGQNILQTAGTTALSTIEINTLEELIEFQKTCGCEIILIDENEIEIYDDFRE